MTDIELVKACAEAMGYQTFSAIPADGEALHVREPDGHDIWYWPLTDDADAMALVKRFRLHIAWSWSGWVSVEGPPKDENEIQHKCRDVDLNRAICECVANLQASKP